MSTSPAKNPVPGVVTFPARGNAALDQLADALVAECDGSPAGIADILERVLEADIEDLAETLSVAAQPAADSPGRDVAEAARRWRALTRRPVGGWGRACRALPSRHRLVVSTSAGDLEALHTLRYTTPSARHRPRAAAAPAQLELSASLSA